MYFALTFFAAVALTGCSRTQEFSSYKGTGCETTCGLCVNLRTECIEDLDAKGVNVEDEVAEPTKIYGGR